MEAFLIIFVFFAFVAVFFGLGWWFEKKRREGMQALAQKLECTYIQDGTALETELQDYVLFSKGSAKTASNVILSEKESFNVAIFDYRYSTGSGKNRSTHSQTVIRVSAVDLELPHFEMRPEHFFDKIGFGSQDIDFDTYPAFSKKYFLRGEQEDAIRETFTEDVIRYFENIKLIWAEGRGNTLLVYRQGRKSKIEDIEADVKEAMQLLSIFVRAK